MDQQNTYIITKSWRSMLKVALPQMAENAGLLQVLALIQ